MDIEINDFVRFKSGGPIMLVANVNTYDSGKTEVYCKWFTTIGEHNSDTFYDSWLEKVEKIDAAMEIKSVNEKFNLLILGKDK